jgi:hypothetical protein
MVQKGAVNLQYISTNEHIVDILTKPLSREKFVYFIDKLGMMKNVSLTEREFLCFSIGKTFSQISHVDLTKE